MWGAGRNYPEKKWKKLIKLLKDFDYIREDFADRRQDESEPQNFGSFNVITRPTAKALEWYRNESLVCTSVNTLTSMLRYSISGKPGTSLKVTQRRIRICFWWLPRIATLGQPGSNWFRNKRGWWKNNSDRLNKLQIKIWLRLLYCLVLYCCRV